MSLEEGNRKELGLSEEHRQWLFKFYEKNGFEPVWFNDSSLNEKGKLLRKTLDQSIYLGIPGSRLRFPFRAAKNPVIKELMITAQSALLIQDLKTGMISDSAKKYRTQRFADLPLFDSLIAHDENIPYVRFFIDHSFSDTNYRFLSEHLYKFCSAYPLDRKTFDIKPFSVDSNKTIIGANAALRSKGYLSENDRDQVRIDAALKLFQKHNGLKPDGKVGKYTASALNESTYNKVLRACLAMDKMRRHGRFPKKYLQVNLPEYKLRFFARDSLRSVHNIICGKPEHATPELRSKLHSIIVYPFWNVPHSIARNEILPAVKSNRNYLKKNNYKIYRGNVEVDPLHVNWRRITASNFPYKVVQQPGPGNSLGVIKFEFFNNYSVYIHDTPAKSLFRSDVRCFSHGCMRCEEPIELGKKILDHDSLKYASRSVKGVGNSITSDSLDSLIGAGNHHVIKLMDHIPVFVEYLTVVADRERMVFHPDIYKRDEDYLEFMRD